MAIESTFIAALHVIERFQMRGIHYGFKRISYRIKEIVTFIGCSYGFKEVGRFFLMFDEFCAKSNLLHLPK